MPAITRHKLIRTQYDDMRDEIDPPKIREERKKKKNWKKFYQDHLDEYDDLEEFHD